MHKDNKIYIAGHQGMVGSAIERSLRSAGFENLIFKTKSELDLTNQGAVMNFFGIEKPDYVIIAAAKVGGIVANNTYKAQFLYENLMIQNNLIHCSYLNNVKKLLFLGSSCIYPRLCPQPMKEEYLLSGPLEPTNEAYAIAKISGIKMCEFYAQQYGCNYIAAMPTNLYGPNDNFDLINSHVLPGIMRKMHLAHCLETGDLTGIRNDIIKRPVKGINPDVSDAELFKSLEPFGITRSNEHNRTVTLSLWGSGNALREFLHVDDLAAACLVLLEQFDNPFISGTSSETDANCFLNIGSGEEYTIRELTEIMRKVIRFEGLLSWDNTKPDGTPRKLLDSSSIHRLGWKPAKSQPEGIRAFYKDYVLSNDGHFV